MANALFAAISKMVPALLAKCRVGNSRFELSNGSRPTTGRRNSSLVEVAEGKLADSSAVGAQMVWSVARIASDDG
jgi:hypothetical protein